MHCYFATTSFGEIVGETFNDQLKKENIAVTRVPFNGEASTKEIERVSDIGKTNQSDLVIGLGGGKTIDAAKAISDKLAIPVAVVPTIASTDAPTSALSVIYQRKGYLSNICSIRRIPNWCW